jgi:hypothetical protein
VAPLEDDAGCRNHLVGALLAGKRGDLLHAVERHLAGAPKDGEHGAVFQVVDGVVTPFPLGDLAAIDLQDEIELASMKRDLARNG